ncbi:MAG TPA: D-arabinono-1,4-lactone oxidase [Solirubrobacteraceae bacterium]|nr:D-arabinono-1,4-lactone oxidase [Solirubrobacteraceae bacterium]
MWRNWAGDQRCEPASIERPRSTSEVVAAVESAASKGLRVRACGGGHSFSDLVPTEGVLLDLRLMDRVLDVDCAGGLARVEAGITIAELSEQLAPHGLALENLGDINVQSIAGAIATATHGTGARLGNISSQVAGVQLVAGDGSVVECPAGADPDVLRAARVSLGALGVLTEVTLRCVPAFTLHGVDRPAPLDETLERLAELVDSNEHFEFFSFPHSDVALTRTNNRTDREPRRRGAARSWAEDILLENGVFGVLSRAGRLAPGRIPQLNRLVTGLASARSRVDRSDRIFSSPRRVRFTEMEWAIPRAAVADAVRGVFELIDRRELQVNFPIEVRFVAGDDALLSPAAGRDTGYVAVHMYRGMPWRAYFEQVEALMVELDGRPHWGKRHFQTAETLRPRYPDWDRFQAVRARLDPDGRFTNDAIERVLGPVEPAAAGAG